MLRRNTFLKCAPPRRGEALCLLGKEMVGVAAATEPLVVRQLCADDPNSIPGRLQALVMDGPVYKTEQLSCCQPPISHISLSMFNFTGSLCFLKCVKLPWADFLARLFSAVGTTVGTQHSRLWCSFCLKQVRSLLFPRLPVLPLPDELGVTCIPSACPPSVKTRDLHLPADIPEPRGTGGTAVSTNPAGGLSVHFLACVPKLHWHLYGHL